MPKITNLPGITIIVCVLNKEETISNCLESLLSLAGKYSLEVLVIDGFSQDKSFGILKKYKKRGVQISQIRGGYSAQLNFGINQAKGGYVLFTDADCIVDKNWLKELVEGFKEKGIVATAGYCGTPKKVDLLQRVIGIELESRFKKFPQYLQRAPTMNLCVKAKIAKRLLFDETIKVGVETDFGYRLNKIGKIKYVPRAIVWHHHRATWKSYFKQQLNTARGAFWVYLKYPKKIKGDHISTPTMMFQVILMGLFFVLFAIGFIAKTSFYLACIILLVFLMTIINDILKIKPKIKYIPPLILLYLVRNIAFVIGSTESLVLYLLKKQKKQKFKL